MSQSKGQYEFDALTVEKTFDSFYVVPDYQREYVWRADEHVEKLLQDVYDAYTNDANKEYFVGTTVVFENKSELELIDGQQRNTTLFLCYVLFAAFIGSEVYRQMYWIRRLQMCIWMTMVWKNLHIV